MQRVAIIGAGPIGLTLLRVIQQSIKGKVLHLVCYEKQDDWGGMWNYTWRTGTDQYGDVIHNSMYHDLWVNIPKEYSEFPDYTFEEHFGKPIPSFPPRAVIRDYVLGYAEKSDVRKYIKFNMRVDSVTYVESKFHLKIWNKIEDSVFCEEFDYVVVATGHFSVPYVPEYAGMDSFPGRILHSHDFRNAEEFRGKDVVVLGNKSSAEDISVQCYKHGSRSVTICYRHNPLGYQWPDNVREVHCLEKIVGRTAYFGDGHRQEADAIILCTGYLYHFPFMEESLRLKTDNQLYPPNLYKGVVWHSNHKLFYLGMQKRFFSFPGLESQTWLVRDVLMEKIILPSIGDIHKDIDCWLERLSSVKNSSDKLNFQAEYLKDICELVGYHKYDIVSYCLQFKAKMKYKGENILTYRDHPFGEAGPVSRVKWLDAVDDSLETFLANC